ncbi:MAG: BRCT domain-containing protein [Planctomycetota bacterium]
MPARRRKQSNAMLYTLITFVGLFIATTTIAVIYYVKAEEYKTGQADLQRVMDDLATDRQRQELGSSVGARSGQQTYLGLMLAYVDETVTLIKGGVPEPTSAEVKINNANTNVATALNLARDHIGVEDPNNRRGLVQAVKELTAKLERTIKERDGTQAQLDDLRVTSKKEEEAHFRENQALTAEKEKLVQAVNDTKQKYDDLSALLQQTTSEQVKTITEQRDKLSAELDAKNAALLRAQAELQTAQDLLKRAQDAVAKVEPGPDRGVLAHEPDGQVILVDDKAQVVHLNIGSNERVYPGLTFTVYDRGGSVSADGQGKAEIKVFDVAKTYSAARIVKSELTKPILQGDVVANLIWDADRTNVFVIAGDFDLDSDGLIEQDGGRKIKTLVEKWGGSVAEAVSVDTDFLVLGAQPQVGEKPTFEQLEVDPRAGEKHAASLQRLNRYNQLHSQAQGLWIPVFTYEKFLYFIGYNSQVSQAGAF